jgi:hypothetical protein
LGAHCRTGQRTFSGSLLHRHSRATLPFDSFFFGLATGRLNTVEGGQFPITPCLIILHDSPLPIRSVNCKIHSLTEHR